METSLIISSENEIQALNHPVTAYLSGLANKNAQRVQRQALEVIANMLIGSSDILACNWPAIRIRTVKPFDLNLLKYTLPVLQIECCPL